MQFGPCPQFLNQRWEMQDECGLHGFGCCVSASSFDASGQTFPPGRPIKRTVQHPAAQHTEQRFALGFSQAVT